MKALKITLNILLGILIAFLLFILVMNVYFLYNKNVLKNNYATFLGYTYQVGLNDSMEPTLKSNDFLISKKQDSYDVGDIITFVSKEKQITVHRIIEITENGYITQGDNKHSPDKEIGRDAVIGKVVVVVHSIGVVLRIMDNPFGAVLIVAIIVVCVLLIRLIITKENDVR